ncbi:MAG: murein biosynthesis integral membrane protein MurJ [Rhodospirillaceae bacterium]|nr:murein biosynthesis integral membrane protein MurJ [Rhodospirillaceae bacterium]
MTSGPSPATPPPAKPPFAHRSLLRNFATVGGMTLISRVTGFVRDIFIAGVLGAGLAADAFLIAFQFPNLFRRLFAEGAFSAGFVPIFSEILEKEGRDKARRFAEEAFAVLAVALLFFVLIMMIFMPIALFAIAPGFDRIPGQMGRAADLARISFPYLLFISLVSLQAGVLNALDRFAAAAATPILLNLTLISAVLFALASGVDAAQALAWGISLAGVIQFAWLAWRVRAAGMPLGLIRPRISPRVKQLIVRILPVVFGASLYQLNLLIDKTIATLVAVGAVSWLYFADRVNQLPLGVIGVGIGVALLPMLTRSIQGGHEDDALAIQNRAIEISLALTLPAAIGLLILANPIAAVLYERGAFTAADRQAVGAALAAFASGLPAYVLIKALVPGFFGRQDTATPVKISVFAMAVNIALNLILMGPLGHVGIAVATAVSAWLNAGLLGYVLMRRGHLVIDRRLVRRLPRMGAAVIGMGLVVWGAGEGVINVFGPLFGADGAAAAGELPRALALAGLIGLGGMVYVGLLLASGGVALTDLKSLRWRPSAPSATDQT